MSMIVCARWVAPVGKPQSFVSNYESGKRRLDLLELQAVCEVVGIKVGDFVGRFEEGQA
jgi:transcriptional regulator with XRE-family HTH domain